MKTVRVYSIKQEQVSVENTVPSIDRHEYVNMSNLSKWVENDNFFSARVGHRIVRIPIERICRNMSPDFDRRFEIEPIVEEEFIAVDPALKGVLTLDMRQKYEDIEHQLKKMKSISTNWWSQPWYKRVWSAIWDAMVEV